MQISWQIYPLEMESPFVISKGSYTHRNALVIKLSQNGEYGLGEATEINYYGISLQRFIDLVEDKIEKLTSITLETPEQYYREIYPILGHESFLCAAFDCAAYDLYGKLNQTSILDYLQVDRSVIPHLPASSFTIGLGSVSEMVDKIQRRPWPIYKIKLGYSNDVEIIEAIRQTTESVIRIDANGGWELDESIEKIERLAKLNVEIIEQPMSRDQKASMAKLFSNSALPLIADESCQGLADIDECMGLFHGINIKLMKCGGITPARQMIQLAKKHSLKIMIGCMTESSIGISAAAQLVPFVDYVDLDGTMLIKEDIATGVTLKNGQMAYPDRPGLGCDLTENNQF